MTQADLQNTQRNKMAATGVVRLADYRDIPQLVEWGANIHGTDRKRPYDHGHAAEYFASVLRNPSLATFISDSGFTIGAIAYEELDTPFPVVVVITGWSSNWSDLLWALEQWAQAAGATEVRTNSPVGVSDITADLSTAGFQPAETLFRKQVGGMADAGGMKGNHNEH